MPEKPIIAVVGRPNVGKSTLFNRLLKRRVAIEHDQPGVTRDRLHADLEWNGVAFTLIDTGGLMTGRQEQMDSLVSAAAEAAIDMADRVVFVADGQRGLTDLDTQIARMVQRHDKPVILAVTKIDTLDAIPEAYSYYSLGLGDPVPVSGSSGLNTGDLLDAMTEGLTPNMDQLDDDEDGPIHLAVLGRPNVGKSSLVNKLLGRDAQIVSDIPGTTRDAIDHEIVHEGREIVLVDTAGLRKGHLKGKSPETLDYFTALRTIRALERADVAAVLIDAVEGVTQYERRLLDEIRQKGKGILVLYNKWDLVEKETMTYKRVQEAFEFALPDLSFVPLSYISALTGKRATTILDKAVIVADRRRARIPTSELNDFFEGVFAHTPPPAIKGRWLRVKYVSQVAVAPPTFAFFLKDPELLPDSYKRFLERMLRESYDFEGVPLKLVFRKK